MLIDSHSTLSQETLDGYRRMSLSQRMKLVLEMTRDNTPALFSGPPELVRRRFELIEQENNAHNPNILEAIVRIKNQKVDTESTGELD